ncbi:MULTISPECIES: hypothetical protein [unclassified Streptomyces]|uniref:hypothetical protein n=1 Tax=unclassified Streptomyces TaxID=2593676 RepID=UPI002E0E672C|nr:MULTISPECIES: hypothetical protein [unclassified Streptomyces]WSR27893.1 hypothetical protein OG573_18150 [Streptomyces sp. NBC_01205]
MAKKQPPQDKANKLKEQAKQKSQEARQPMDPMSEDMDREDMGMEMPEDRPRPSRSPRSS